MSDGKRPFWSSVPGLITGLAGLLTGVVGLITLLVQQGVIGHDSGSTTGATGTTVTSTVAGGTSGTTSGAPGRSTEAGSFTLNPSALDFGPTDPKQKTVTVKNTSTSATLTINEPIRTGTDADRFSASLSGCTALAPNLSCTIQVTFTPTSGAALKKYSATLQVTASGAARGAEVALTASTLL